MSALEIVFAGVVEASWRAGILIGMFLIVRRYCASVLPAAFLHFVWIIVALRLVLPFWMPVAWPALTTISPPIWSENLHPTEDASFVATSLPPATAHSIGLAGRTTVDAWSTARWLALIWFIGACGLASLRFFRVQQFWRKVRVDLERNAEVDAAVGHATQTLGVKRRIDALMTSAVAAPAIAGLLRPCILFPKGFTTQLSEAELRWVVLHELSHWRRRDGWSHSLMEWARILHWFNPLVWISVNAARLDCELACDQFVIRRAAAAAPAEYGAALLKVLGVVRGQTQTSLAVGVLENKQQLKRRIQMIAQYSRSTRWQTILGAALCGVLSVSTLVRAQTSEPQRSQAPSSLGSDVIPAGWFKNGTHPGSYVVSIDEKASHKAPVSICISSTEPEINGFGGMMQNFKAVDFLEKRVRFSAWIKTEDAAKSANIWLRVDGNGEMLRFDNLHGRAPTGNSDWKHYSVVLDVPKDAINVAMGFFVGGTGKAWFNDARFDVVDASIPETALPQPKGMKMESPKAPQNLRFDAAKL